MLRLIRRHMKEEGLTMKELAHRIGVNYQYFSDMLSGRTPITDGVARYFQLERLDYVFAPRQNRRPRKSRAASRRP